MRERSDGRWEARIRLGDGRRRSVFGRTQREAIDRLRALRVERDAGLHLEGRREPLEAYIARWLEQRDPRRPVAGVRKLRQTTWNGYEVRMRKHVAPMIGKISLADVTPEHVRRTLAKVAAAGLSATTVAMVRDTLATILERAVKDRVLPFNPCKAVDSVPRSAPRKYVLTPDQARAIMRAAAGDRLEAVFVVALHTGLRAGELFGLAWSDVNLEAATLTVRHSLVRVKGEGLVASAPKTAASAAKIPLTSSAIAALRAHRLRQIEERLGAGRAWQDTGYVFTTELGTPISESNFLRRHFYPVVERAGIPTREQPDGSQGLRLHDLRHGCGTLLISLGVKPKIVQAILRHARLSTTMDLYVHAYDEDMAAGVAVLDRALGS